MFLFIFSFFFFFIVVKGLHKKCSRRDANLCKPQWQISLRVFTTFTIVAVTAQEGERGDNGMQKQVRAHRVRAMRKQIQRGCSCRHSKRRSLSLFLICIHTFIHTNIHIQYTQTTLSLYPVPISHSILVTSPFSFPESIAVSLSALYSFYRRQCMRRRINTIECLICTNAFERR